MFNPNRPPSEQLENKMFTIELKDNESIVVKEMEPGVFKIVDNSITKKDEHQMAGETFIGFGEWDDEVVDLDSRSSDARYFDMSEHLRWEDVEFIGDDEIKAPSLDRLKQALQHIKILPYNPEDM